MTIISFHNFSPHRANKKGAPTRLNLIGTPKRGTTQLKRVNNSFSLLPVANGTGPIRTGLFCRVFRNRHPVRFASTTGFLNAEVQLYLTTTRKFRWH